MDETIHHKEENLYSEKGNVGKRKLLKMIALKISRSS
jgi:hypothetical protein